jgi:hypothetical protein
MTDQHPITPPPELVKQWEINATLNRRAASLWTTAFAAEAAQWGADQQLAKDAKWLDHNSLNESHLRITPIGESLREAMRPKPPTLKEQALVALMALEIDEPGYEGIYSTIRRALEALDD